MIPRSSLTSLKTFSQSSLSKPFSSFKTMCLRMKQESYSSIGIESFKIIRKVKVNVDLSVYREYIFLMRYKIISSFPFVEMINFHK